MIRQLAYLFCVFSLIAVASVTSATVTGRVVDSTGQPVVGATARLFHCDASRDALIAGAVANERGDFKVSVVASDPTCVVLMVSSVGFTESSVEYTIDHLRDTVVVTLEPAVSEIPGIRVVPDVEAPSVHTINADEVSREALHSLVPTNPTAALKQPEISRVGSAHSSQIRVHGTNPVYSLNGIPIGTDPSHYGMFAVIPAPIVDQVLFHAHGTDASQRLPSTVEFSTPAPFAKSFGVEAVVSTIDATATFHSGGDRYFVLGALRKSVLDRLVNQFDVSTDRRTLPPTNFQDVFGSVGYRLNDHIQLIVDQYHVRDYLSYNSSGATDGASNVSTSQKSRESYVGLRADMLYDDLLIESQVAIQDATEFYAAGSLAQKSPHALYLHLEESTRSVHARSTTTFSLGDSELKAGLRIERDLDRSFDLKQRNWNFLPPFANTDNPYIYQDVLNEGYGDLEVDVSGYTAAAFVSHQRRVHGFDVTTGVRVDRYSTLATKNVLSVRARVGYEFENGSYLELFGGTFSASPIDNILEAYQAIVRADVAHLEPVGTKLLSATYRHGPVTGTVFEKHINNLATVTPDFSSEPQKGREAARQFIRVASSGSAVFRGFSLAYDPERWLDNRLEVHVSYGYTYAERVDNNVTLDYDLNAPHRLFVKALYRLNSRFQIGGELQVRSGYPYSPIRTGSYAGSDQTYYSQEYYEDQLSEENSLRFPAHAYLNISGTYTFGHNELFLSISNLTNRANPIINSGSGMIYDAGIMPMFGVRIKW